MPKKELFLKGSLKKIKNRKQFLEDINNLLGQLSSKESKICLNDILRILKGDVEICIVFHKDKIVGMGSIHFTETFIRKVGIIEDVVVDKNYQGKRIGQSIVEVLINEARKNGVNCIDLTSNPKRVAAVALYKKLGFKERETNLYRLEF
ncbi:GNAT family N-acetyltransferase [Patescibacteria group bacterium]|nr:GNAT family N-acetyltransferase [Patescibacteria group bacterium]